MAYLRNNLVSRAGYGGSMGGFFDTVGDIAKGTVTFFGAQQRAAGATDALTQANKDLIAAQAAQNAGPSPALIVGGLAVAGLAAFIILRKKKGS